MKKLEYKTSKYVANIIFVTQLNFIGQN